MIKRIADIGLSNNHEYKVSEAIDELQRKGNIVTRVEKISRVVLMFGINITEIYYESALS